MTLDHANTYYRKERPMPENITPQTGPCPTGQAPGQPETYEGWSNYPTWCVNLWLSNDEGLYNETQEKARFASNQADPSNGLASSLKYWVSDELVPDLGATFAADLLGYALGEVDWYEIADAWLEEVPDEDEQA